MDLDPDTAMCFDQPGHVGWIVCQVHGKEIQAKVAELHASPDQSRPPAPKHCPGCGHAFHPAGNCAGLGLGRPRCPCERNMAVHLDIPDPALPQPLMTDLERNRFGSVDDVRRWHDRTHSGGHKSGQECQVAYLLAELARAQQLMATAFEQRDLYLAELQKQRAVIEDMETISAVAIPRLEALRAVVDAARGVLSPWTLSVAARDELRSALAALDAIEPYRQVLHTHPDGAHANTSSESTPDRGTADA